MSKLKGFYQNNRIFVILMGIASVCLVIILTIAVAYMVNQTSGDVYGNRLNGIETVPITDEKIKTLEDTIKVNETVEKVNVRLSGKIIYINCYITAGKASDAKNIAIKVLDIFTDDEKSFYDLAFTFSKVGEEDNAFPIMGYKKSDNTIISWTNIGE